MSVSKLFSKGPSCFRATSATLGTAMAKSSANINLYSTLNQIAEKGRNPQNNQLARIWCRALTSLHFNFSVPIEGLSKSTTLKQTSQINGSLTEKIQCFTAASLPPSASPFFYIYLARLNGLLHCCSAIISTHLSRCGFFCFLKELVLHSMSVVIKSLPKISLSFRINIYIYQFWERMSKTILVGVIN